MKRYAIVGSGARALEMFAKPLTEHFADVAKLVGIYDTNRTRAEFLNHCVSGRIPVYTDFKTMMRETTPDCTIITTIDSCHSEYITKSLESGVDVIAEKPLAIDAIGCKAILDAECRTGRRVTVTFNCRFMPINVMIKELLSEGTIGEVLSVDLEWFLDRTHGADYFRRWHRYMDKSGGLLVHKATHHFDLVNWWISDLPDEIYASGSLRFYGGNRLEYGLRCRGCQHAGDCAYRFCEASCPAADGLYFGAEHEDGYLRDKCVFDYDIDIYDTMSVTVKYKRGCILTYSLVAYAPCEGWRLSVTGTEGRIETDMRLRGDNTFNGLDSIHVFLPYDADGQNRSRTLTMPRNTSKHMGADEQLRQGLFRGIKQDNLHQYATACDGVKAVMIGICANRSIKDGRMVAVNEDFGVLSRDETLA